MTKYYSVLKLYKRKFDPPDYMMFLPCLAWEICGLISPERIAFFHDNPGNTPIIFSLLSLVYTGKLWKGYFFDTLLPRFIYLIPLLLDVFVRPYSYENFFISRINSLICILTLSYVMVSGIHTRHRYPRFVTRFYFKFMRWIARLYYKKITIEAQAVKWLEQEKQMLENELNNSTNQRQRQNLKHHIAKADELIQKLKQALLDKKK